MPPLSPERWRVVSPYLDQALETFVAEARDLLQAMEDALLSFNDAEQDSESVNAIFRAAHTIKGSAGLFGLDDIVGFTHGLESVLDLVRGGKLHIDVELIALLLACRDHLGGMVERVAAGERGVDPAMAEHGAGLTAKLSQYLGVKPAAKASAGTSSAKPAHPLPAAVVGEPNHWHLSVRFGQDVLRNGMDPVSFIRYLGTIGEVLRAPLENIDFPADLLE